ncbi:hypothetical protein ACXET9_15360 [Brachybacterium sp. DNPG3]
MTSVPPSTPPEFPPSAPAANPLGVAALVAGVLLLLLRVAASLTSMFIPLISERIGFSYVTISGAIQAPQVIMALIATVLGVIALLLPRRRRAAAIIATTLGVSDLVLVLTAWIGVPILAALTY